MRRGDYHADSRTLMSGRIAGGVSIFPPAHDYSASASGPQDIIILEMPAHERWHRLHRSQRREFSLVSARTLSGGHAGRQAITEQARDLLLAARICRIFQANISASSDVVGDGRMRAKSLASALTSADAPLVFARLILLSQHTSSAGLLELHARWLERETYMVSFGDGLSRDMHTLPDIRSRISSALSTNRMMS